MWKELDRWKSNFKIKIPAEGESRHCFMIASAPLASAKSFKIVSNI